MDDMTHMINELDRHIQRALSTLDDIEGEQGEGSDKGNAQTIEDVRQILEDASGRANDLVP